MILRLLAQGAVCEEFGCNGWSRAIKSRDTYIQDSNVPAYAHNAFTSAGTCM
ncbi:Malolactic regulator [Lacticaseibacillus rhamnosus]|uniref:Malolactic regulator n=1 Tax=Lacticaseibacillus rhamnosus TaxID=47715 RepID=A0AAP8J1R6_LACRH|nr:Malolactic regulator [Lacticaseibacillus rhamnosus]PTM22808.1 Malolactic regulator [Lacticaseibacillus rhamnosus]TXK08322.1 Malolactic regulator [Lacticaseibacillus rhamnosus]